MASGAGQTTAAGTVDYLGDLFQTSKRPNALLRMLGGLGNVVGSKSREFPTGVFYDLSAPSQPARLEGAAAPTAEHREITQATNVVQVFHEAVDVSYLAQSDKTITGVVPLPQGPANGTPNNPRTTEWQVERSLEKIAQDANYSFLRGTYANPADPASTALRTRGAHTAITTNVVDQTAGGAIDVTKVRAYIEQLVRTVVAKTGFSIDQSWFLFADATMFNNAQAAYEGKLTAPYDRNIAGLQIQKIITRMGTLNLVLEPDMPADTIDIFNIGAMAVVGLEVPGKGILFEEALSKTGSSDKTQIYGQLGIDHGPEWMHGKLLVPAGSAAL